MTNTKKIRVVSILLIAVIIISAGAAITVVRNQEVKSVSGISMESNSASSVIVRWDNVKRADGYYIYYCNGKSSDNGKGKYERLGKVDGGDTCSYEIKNLPGATVYDIKVSAFRNYLGKEYESEAAQKVRVYSLPNALEVSAFSGGRGILSVEWETADNLSGYEIQYAKDDKFSDSSILDIPDSDARNISIEGLNPGDTYYVKGRSYLMDENDKIYGSWGNIANTIISEKDLHIGNINPNKPMVALSFDDGPAFDYNGENSTERILDVLEKHNARATFFMVGERVNDETKRLLQREIELGCELGNHTYNHIHYGENVTATDISKASKRIKKYCGKSPDIFRCPGGNLTADIRNECEKEGMPLAYWSVDTEDWRSKDAKKIYKNVISQAYDGAIILMHDIYPSTADAVEKIVPKLIEKGYQIVTVSEMIEAKTGNPPKPGQQYIDSETINNKTK
ncbi:MAG: polysaccharide deacetylase family protein [Eubacteriales bacterium]|nr:polysaccharide deacetylase family protein [Eubacteriales bacterium]